MGVLSKFFVLFLISTTVFAAVRDWPPEAQEFLAKLPNKQLPLDFVVARALEKADSFQIHSLEALRAEATYFQAVAFEDLKLKASYNRFDNQNEPLLPQFQPSSIKGWEASVGAEKYFSTGTAVSLDGYYNPKRVGFLSGTGFEAFETRMTLGVQQDLLGNFFGSSYRSSKRAASSLRESLLSGALSKTEVSTLEVIGLYYQAWLKKELAVNALEARRRKEKLVKILQSQLRRGVVEAADVLQIEGAALQSELEFTNTQLELQTLWEQLVINLKLPRSFLKVPVQEIPLVLDTPEEKSLQLCQGITFADLEKNSTPLREADQLVNSAREKYLAQKEKLLPDLKFNASYTANSIEADDFQGNSGYQAQSHKTFREVSELENPAWTAGLQLSFPLQNRAMKAQYLTAKADFEQARLRKSILLTDLENKWSQSCAQLKLKKDARDKYKQMSLKNKKRVEIDNRRFEVGRIKAFQWVQTEDDEATSNLLYKQAEVEVRQISWDIQRQTGHMTDLIKAYLPKEATSYE